jgi:hypothetical protein
MIASHDSPPRWGSTGTGLPENADQDLYADDEPGVAIDALIDELRSPLAPAHVKRLLNDREGAISSDRDWARRRTATAGLLRSDDLRDKRGIFSREAAGEFKGA